MPKIHTKEQSENWVDEQDLVIQLNIGIKFNFEDNTEQLDFVLNTSLDDKIVSYLLISYYTNVYLDDMLEANEIPDVLNNIFQGKKTIDDPEVAKYLEAKTRMDKEKLKTYIKLLKKR